MAWDLWLENLEEEFGGYRMMNLLIFESFSTYPQTSTSHALSTDHQTSQKLLLQMPRGPVLVGNSTNVYAVNAVSF
jgi:hypothetical protein